MHPLEKKVLQVIKDNGLMEAGDSLGVGVSGGADSVALFSVLHCLAECLDISLAAVHVDHGLRPAEAAAEKALIESLAKKSNCPFWFRKVPVQQCAEANKYSIEQAARHLRYQAFADASAALGLTKIAVAHTADDQVEEMLIRLLRGGGKNSLSGMKLIREGHIVRPFLQCRKEALLAYLQDKGLGYCEDSSNKERVYLRNRIRLDLLPYLEQEFNPRIRETLLQSAEILRAEDEFLDKRCREIYDQLVTVVDDSVDPALEIDLAGIRRQPLALQRRLLEKVFIDMGANPSYRQIDQVLDLLKTEKNTAVAHLPQGLRAIKQEGVLHFCYPKGRTRERGNLFEAE